MRWWLLPLLALSLAAAPAQADPLCAADLNGNGDAADPGEISACTATIGGRWQCPLQAMSCTGSAAGTYACPLGDQFACETPLSGGTPTCSPHECIDSATGGIVDEPIADDPGTPPMAPWTPAVNASARSKSSPGALCAAGRRA